MAQFIRHTSCDSCGSSDANAEYSDGSSYCFSCGIPGGPKRPGFVGKEEKHYNLPDDLSHDYKGDLILFIPRYYFENTYRISVLTYLIRVCNVTEVITDWKKHPTKSIDNTSPTYHDRIIDRGFVEPVKGYWYYVGKMHSPQKNPQTSTVHNCGMNAWMAAADKEGLL